MKVNVLQQLTRLTVLHVKPWFQNDEPSSKLNRTPPIGAPNAATQTQQRKDERRKPMNPRILTRTLLNGFEAFHSSSPLQLKWKLAQVARKLLLCTNEHYGMEKMSHCYSLSNSAQQCNCSLQAENGKPHSNKLTIAITVLVHVLTSDTSSCSTGNKISLVPECNNKGKKQTPWLPQQLPLAPLAPPYRHLCVCVD